MGKPLMPWQQLVVDTLLEIDPDTGGLAYSQFGLTVPRQSGKSTLILAKVIHRGLATQFFGSRQMIVYTAQTRKDAHKKWEFDYAPQIAESRYLQSRIKPNWAPGNEHMKFPNGSRFLLESTTEKAGHGPTVDEAYIDEAFAQVDSRTEQAFRPSMITRPNTLLGWVSTAGWLNASPFLESKVKWGRSQVDAGSRTGLAYFEWSAPEDAEPDDRDVWRACMPALGHTISERDIEIELEQLSGEGKLDEFRRAYLNQWVPKPVSNGVSVIPPDKWRACTDDSSKFGPNRAVLAVDVSPDRSMTNIAGAGTRDDGRVHVELLERLPGTYTAVAALERLIAKRGPLKILVDASGAAGSLLPDLDRARIEYTLVDAKDISQACGAFYDAVVDGTVTHIGQEPLTAAVLAATNKTMVRGGWKWFPLGPNSISPLWAATLAAYGLAKYGPKDYDLMNSAW